MPALDTKVKALYAKLLDDSQYVELIDMDSLPEVIKYLKENTQFGELLKDVNPDTVSRTVIEDLFNRIVITNAQKILYFINGSGKRFIRLVIRQINLTTLLILVRALAKKENLQDYSKRLAFSQKDSKINFSKIIDSENWAQFKDELKDTSYFRSIEGYDDLNSNDLFVIEKTMERSYYDLVYKDLNQLKNDGNDKLIKILRIEIDLLNLIWIYRAKKFYHFTSEQILPYIYRGGLRINEDDLLKLSEASDIEELMTEVKKYPEYSFMFDHEGTDLDLHMNRRMKRYLYYQFKELFFFDDGIGEAYAYLQLLIDEISDIISIIEAKRYKLSREETIQYLIRHIK